MGESTAIEWAQATWNPWYGCHKVSPGCKHCYMYRDMAKYGREPKTVTRSKTTFDAPLKWAKSGKVEAGARIFTCSWSDWFIDEADGWRDEAWDVVRRTPQFTYLILTKRPERIAGRLPIDWGQGYPNVWLGTSVENQDMANKRVPQLLAVPAAVRFLSAEPLLGPIDLFKIIDPKPAIRANATLIFTTITFNALSRKGGIAFKDGIGIDWVITGGESHPSAPRPCDLDWVRSIRDQCQQAGVALFHKQHGGSRKVEGTWGGRSLDGRTWDEFPEVAHV